MPVPNRINMAIIDTSIQQIVRHQLDGSLKQISLLCKRSRSPLLPSPSNAWVSLSWSLVLLPIHPGTTYSRECVSKGNTTGTRNVANLADSLVAAAVSAGVAETAAVADAAT